MSSFECKKFKRCVWFVKKVIPTYSKDSGDSTENGLIKIVLTIKGTISDNNISIKKRTF